MFGCFTIIFQGKVIITYFCWCMWVCVCDRYTAPSLISHPFLWTMWIDWSVKQTFLWKTTLNSHLCSKLLIIVHHRGESGLLNNTFILSTAKQLQKEFMRLALWPKLIQVFYYLTPVFTHKGLFPYTNFHSSLFTMNHFLPKR